MQIKEARIFNFGKIQNQTFHFAPGINVVYGENETGKTTLHTFLKGMLFGMERGRGRVAETDDYSRYEPWHAPSYYCGALRFTVGNRPFYLERNFYTKEKSDFLRNEADGEELSVTYGDLEMLLGGIGKEIFGNTYDITQSGAVTGEAMGTLISEYLADAAGGGEGSLHVRKAIQALNARKKELAGELKQKQAEREAKAQDLQMKKDMLEQNCLELRENIKKSEKTGIFGKGSNEAEFEETLNLTQKQEASDLVEEKGIWQLFAMIAGIVGIAATGAGYLFFQTGQEGAIARTAIFGCLLMVGIFSKMRRKRALLREKQRLLAQARREQEVRAQAMKEQRLREQEALEHADKMLQMMKDGLLEKENELWKVMEQLQEFSSPSEKEKELQENIQALLLAAAELERLSQEYYEEIEDELNGEISRWVSLITNGKYDRIRLDEEGKLWVQAEGREVRPQALSRGTLEQIYLALRLAVGDILTKEEELPVFLDEAFSMYDDVRLEQTLKALSKTGRQILLFTCQHREADLMEQAGIPYYKIELVQESTEKNR